MANELNLKKDAFSHGQIHSKLWLCRELEKICHDRRNLKIWVLGGWYGMLSFLLLSRQRLSIQEIHSFDMAPDTKDLAMSVNNAWSIGSNVFKAHVADCSCLSFTTEEFAAQPDIVINTSCEHFSNYWFSLVPKGTLVALQSTDMPHEEHILPIHSKTEMQEKFSGISKTHFLGTLRFNYQNFKFTRYMLIGQV